jgi:hypothetical protein
MISVWHKEDVFNAFRHRGWLGSVLLAYPEDWHYVGEAWSFSRTNCTLNLYFVADYSTGFHGADSIESIAGRLTGDSKEYDLWLRRTRDVKWKASVIMWADQVSIDHRVERAPQFRQIH